MKKCLLTVVCLISIRLAHSQGEVIKWTPEMLVQQQLDGYNARNIDTFLEPYSEGFEIYSFPNEFSLKGKDKARESFKELLKKYPKLHCELVNRMVLGNKVIDHERITGMSDLPYETIAIYEIENGKIVKVTFVRK